MTPEQREIAFRLYANNIVTANVSNLVDAFREVDRKAREECADKLIAAASLFTASPLATPVAEELIRQAHEIRSAISRESAND